MMVGISKQINFSIQFILNQMMLSRLMTNTSIGFKSVQKSSQNILLNLLQNHFLNFVKQLVDPSKCMDDGIAQASILLDLIWRRFQVLVSLECLQRLVIYLLLISVIVKFQTWWLSSFSCILCLKLRLRA